MRYLFYSLPLGIFLSVGVGLTSAADSVLRGYAVAEETIVPGEAPDLARVSAFMRARLELIESIAKAAQDQTLTLAGVREDLEAAIADHLAVRILREVQQEDARGRRGRRRRRASRPAHGESQCAAVSASQG